MHPSPAFVRLKNFLLQLHPLPQRNYGRASPRGAETTETAGRQSEVDGLSEHEVISRQRSEVLDRCGSNGPACAIAQAKVSPPSAGETDIVFERQRKLQGRVRGRNSNNHKKIILNLPQIFTPKKGNIIYIMLPFLFLCLFYLHHFP